MLRLICALSRVSAFRLTYQIRNLDAAEQKCDKLTALLRSLNPDVDIETPLKSGLSTGGQEANNPSPKSPEQVDEASPGSSHEYEWHETPLSTEDEQIH
jgi:transcriptional regulatory protein GAL4